MTERRLNEDALRKASPTATPNQHLVALADDILGRNGRMVDAIRAIGRAQNIYLDLENRSQEELDEIKSQFEALAAKARARQVNAHMDVPK